MKIMSVWVRPSHIQVRDRLAEVAGRVNDTLSCMGGSVESNPVRKVADVLLKVFGYFRDVDAELVAAIPLQGIINVQGVGVVLVSPTVDLNAAFGDAPAYSRSPSESAQV